MLISDAKLSFKKLKELRDKGYKCDMCDFFDPRKDVYKCYNRIYQCNTDNSVMYICGYFKGENDLYIFNKNKVLIKNEE